MLLQYICDTEEKKYCIYCIQAVLYSVVYHRAILVVSLHFFSLSLSLSDVLERAVKLMQCEKFMSSLIVIIGISFCRISVRVSRMCDFWNDWWILLLSMILFFVTLVLCLWMLDIFTLLLCVIELFLFKKNNIEGETFS